MPNGADETQRRLERLLADANRTIAPRPIQADAPATRARHAIRVRYAAIAAGFVALTVVLTATTVVAREIVSDDGGPTGPTATGPTTTTPTIAPSPTVTGPWTCSSTGATGARAASPW